MNLKSKISLLALLLFGLITTLALSSIKLNKINDRIATIHKNQYLSLLKAQKLKKELSNQIQNTEKKDLDSEKLDYLLKKYQKKNDVDQEKKLAASNKKKQMNLEKAQENKMFYQRLINYNLVAIAFLIAYIAFYVIFGIICPIDDLNAATQLIIGKIYGENIPQERRGDEIGNLARAIVLVKENAKKQEARIDEWEDFAYNSAQDIHEPLNSTIGLIEITEEALRNGDQEKVFTSLATVKDSLNRLEALVHNILDFTKCSKSDEEITDINLKKAVLASLRELAEMDPDYSKVKVKLDIDDNLSVKSKESLLKLIFLNIASNAVKYKDAEKDTPYLAIKNKEKDGKLFLEFEDNGIGIPRQYHDQIFTMFKRFHPGVSYGSGLGLYIIKKSCDLLKTAVAYKPHKKGSTFKVELDKAKVAK